MTPDTPNWAENCDRQPIAGGAHSFIQNHGKTTCRHCGLVLTKEGADEYWELFFEGADTPEHLKPDMALARVRGALYGLSVVYAEVSPSTVEAIDEAIEFITKQVAREKALVTMLRKLLSHSYSNNQYYSKDWAEARALLERIETGAPDTGQKPT